MPANLNQGDTDWQNAILPTQFWGSRSSASTPPELRLMAAVLEEAVALVVRSNGRAHCDAATDEACAWLACNDRSGPFSFVSICDVLGLEPAGVREAVERLGGAGDFVRSRVSAGRGRHRVTQHRRRRRAA